MDKIHAQWGDFGKATNNANGKSVFFIVGDKKGSMKNIEVSLKFLDELGISVKYETAKSHDGKESVQKVKSVATTNKVDAIYDIDITIFRNSNVNCGGSDNGKSGANKGTNDRDEINAVSTWFQSQLNEKKE